MRNRFAWFIAGVVIGAIALYLGLWKGGVFEPYFERARATATRTEPAPAPRPAPPPVAESHPAPQTLPAPTPAAPGGEADRMKQPWPSAKAIFPPIENLKAADILDTFSQGRSGGRTHQATDIMEPRGTPVRAMVDGTIMKLFLSKPGGNTVYQFDDAQQYCYYYAHLDKYADGIQEGQHVSRGTVIGYVGSTGDADPSAPHLHLAINVLAPDKHWWQGTPINPHPILMQTLDPAVP